MEHTNLFLYENENAIRQQYPDGKINSPKPAVAYGKGGNLVVFYNDKKTRYNVTLNCVSIDGVSSYTYITETIVQSPEVLDGDWVTFKVKSPDLLSLGYEAYNEENEIMVCEDTIITLYYRKLD